MLVDICSGTPPVVCTQVCCAMRCKIGRHSPQLALRRWWCVTYVSGGLAVTRDLHKPTAIFTAAGHYIAHSRYYTNAECKHTGAAAAECTADARLLKTNRQRRSSKVRCGYRYMNQGHLLLSVHLLESPNSLHDIVPASSTRSAGRYQCFSLSNTAA